MGSAVILFVLSIERHKAESLWVEVQFNLTNGTITVFSNDEVGYIFTFCVWIVICLAVNKHNNVGILLDRAGLTQVGQLRNLR